MKYIINAFTPKMLKSNANLKISVEPSNKLEILKNKDNCISAIGHYNIAEHLGIEKNRMSIILEKGDTAYLVESKRIADKISYDYKKITVS